MVHIRKCALIIAGAFLGVCCGLIAAFSVGGAYLGMLWIYVYGDSVAIPDFHIIPVAIFAVVSMAIGGWHGAKIARSQYIKWVAQGKNITLILLAFYTILAASITGLYLHLERVRIEEKQQRIQREIDERRGCEMLKSLPIISAATAKIVPDGSAVNVDITVSGTRQGTYAIEVEAVASSKNKTIHTFKKDITPTSFPLIATMHIPAAPLIKTWQENYSHLYGHRSCDSVDFIVTLRPYFDKGKAPIPGTPHDCGMYDSYDGRGHWLNEHTKVEGENTKWYMRHKVWYEDQLTATLCPNMDRF